MPINISGSKLEGYLGTWYVIDYIIRNGELFLLWESEEYGEDADHIVTRMYDEGGTIKYDVLSDDCTDFFEEVVEDYFN